MQGHFSPGLYFLNHKVRRSDSVILKGPLPLKNPRESMFTLMGIIQSAWSLWTVFPGVVKLLPREKHGQKE